MTVQFCPAKIDYVRAVEAYILHQRRSYKRWRKIFLGVCLTVIVLLTLMLLALEGPRALARNPMIWILLLYFIVFNRRTLARVSLALNRRSGRIDRHHFENKTVTLADTKLEVNAETPGYQEAIPYASITALYRTRDQIMVHFSNSLFFYLPRRFFPDEASYDTFFRELSLRCGEAAEQRETAPETPSPDDGGAFCCRFDCTPEVFIRIQLAYARYLRTHFRVDAGLCLLTAGFLACAVFGWILLRTGIAGTSVWGIYLWFVGAVFVWLILLCYVRLPVFVRWSARGAMKKDRVPAGTIGPHDCVFSERGIRKTIGGMNLFTEWAQVDEIWDDGSFLFVLRKRYCVACLPLSSIPEDERGPLYAYIHNRIEAAGHAPAAE